MGNELIKNKYNLGQALVEIVFSVSIVAVVLSGLVIAVVYSQKATRLAHERSEATQLAQRKIEAMRSEENRDHDQFWSDYPSGYDNSEVDLGSNEKFTRRTQILDIDGASPNRRAEIRVTVSWQDGNQDVVLNSYITEY
jgi:type II secretory pathway pseudopilin PulG